MVDCRAVYQMVRPPLCAMSIESNGFYFAVKLTDAITFSHSTCNLPLFPPAGESVILSCSTGDEGLLMVMAATPTSSAATRVVLPSRLMPHCPVFLLTMSFHLPESRSAYSE